MYLIASCWKAYSFVQWDLHIYRNMVVLGAEIIYCHEMKYRGADKSLARPEMKQATETEDFDVHISYLLS